MKTSYGYRLHANGELIKVDQDARSKPDASEPRYDVAVVVRMIGND
jgi:hypothetical protein